MEDQDTSLESIVVLPESFVTECDAQSQINCFQDNDTYVQSTFRQSPLNDTASSSFMNTSAETECQKMEKEILALKSQLIAYKSENSSLRQKLSKRTHRESFTDIDSVALIEKFEQLLVEANKIFSDDFKLRDSMIYLIKNIWSSIAFDYTDTRLANITNIRDELLNKIEKSANTDAFETKLKLLENQIKELSNINLKFKSKLIQQNKILHDLTNFFPKLESKAAENFDSNEEESNTLTNQNNNTKIVASNPVQSKLNNIESESIANMQTPYDFFYYPTNGYIAIDKDLSLNEEIKKFSNSNKTNEPIKPESSNLFKCPKCLTTIDSEKINFENFKSHVELCKGDSNLVCCFCLKCFDKNKSEEYLIHLDVHLRQLESGSDNF